MTLQRRSTLRVSKNALALLFAQVWAKLLSLVLVALVARYESAAGLGQYVLALTVVGFAGAIGDLGLNVFVTREVARARDGQRQRELLGTALPLKLGLAMATWLTLMAIAALAPLPGATRALLPLAGLLLLPEAALGAMRAFVNGRQRMEVSSAIDMAVRLIALAAAFPALVAGLGVAGVLASTVGASLVGAACYGALLWRWRTPPLWRWSVTGWRACLVESYPFAVTSLAAMVYARVDMVLLGLWQGETAAGWYGAAYRLWETVGLLPSSLLDAMFPEMSRLAGNQDRRHRLESLFRTAGRAMSAGGLLLVAAGIPTAGVLIGLVYGSTGEYAAAVLPFRLLVCGIPAMFLYLLSGHILYALGKQRQVTAAMLIVGVVNVSLNLFVIPRWSFVGAAAVALGSEWLLAAILYPRARRALISPSRSDSPSESASIPDGSGKGM
jgi:O-antigen/teichoic acid export membrane protein